MTTLEIAENKSLFPFGASMIDKFIQILQTSDLVKYARYDSDKFQERSRSDLICGKYFEIFDQLISFQKLFNLKIN